MSVLFSLLLREEGEMSYHTELSVSKYYRLTDLASRWKLDVCELLRLILERGIGVAILEFRGADHHVANPTDDDEFPSWAVFVAPDVLKKIASVGEAYIGGGTRFDESEATPVFFPERRLTVEDLIVLPEAFAELASLAGEEASEIGSDEPEMSPASRNTLLKQIAALAILLSREHKRFACGDKPNSSEIALAISQAIALLPAEQVGNMKLNFYSKSKINDSIREGLELLGFKKASEEK